MRSYLEGLLIASIALATATVLMFMIATIWGCGLPQPKARALGYEFVYRAARSVKAADHLCAEVALERKDKKLADTCAHGYDVARHGLMSIEATLDAWKEGDDGRLGCEAASALRGINELGGGLSGAGLPRPVDLGHAATVAEAIAKHCVAVADDGGDHVRY